MGVYDRDRTFNFITRNGNKDKIIDKKWLTLSGLLEETNNTRHYTGGDEIISKLGRNEVTEEMFTLCPSLM